MNDAVHYDHAGRLDAVMVAFTLTLVLLTYLFRAPEKSGPSPAATPALVCSNCRQLPPKVEVE
jgi:hypothetical protein